MELTLKDRQLQIKLNPLETVLSHRRSLHVPLRNVVSVSTERPRRNWKQIRAPGTYLPFLLKAGTYHTGRGREFWHATIGKPVLAIELRDWDYKRIVLTHGDNETWAKVLRHAAERERVLRPSQVLRPRENLSLQPAA